MTHPDTDELDLFSDDDDNKPRSPDDTDIGGPGGSSDDVPLPPELRIKSDLASGRDSKLGRDLVEKLFKAAQAMDDPIKPNEILTIALMPGEEFGTIDAQRIAEIHAIVVRTMNARLKTPKTDEELSKSPEDFDRVSVGYSAGAFRLTMTAGDMYTFGKAAWSIPVTPHGTKGGPVVS